MDDLTISNQNQPSQFTQWQFDIAEPRANFNLTNTATTNIHEGALVGRSTMTAGTDCIISFPDTGVAPKLTGTMTVTLGSSCGKAGMICGKRELSATFSKTFSLPVLSESDFNKEEGNQTL